MNNLDWLEITAGTEPLIVSLPHTGTRIPPEIENRYVSLRRARHDTDWHIEKLYDFATGLGATVIRTDICRCVIDVNRDPSGQSLYPGMTTTELCPTTTFDGLPLYRDGDVPTDREIAERTQKWFDPYHAALIDAITRTKANHGVAVLYDCHSIRSVIPRLFDGILPNFNIGTADGKSCAPDLTARIEAIAATTSFTRVVNGRFKGGYITRQHGDPSENIHAIQMELANRGYLREPPLPISEECWPVDYDPSHAMPMRDVLRLILGGCLNFARERRS